MGCSKTIWVDTETTGLNCKEDQIIELAALCGKDTFHEYCLPKEKPKNWDKIEELTGITWEFLEKNGISEDVLYHRFEMWLGNHVDRYNKKDKAVFAGYGSRFDSDFIRAMFERFYNKFYGSYFISITLDVQSFVAENVASGIITLLDNFKLSTVCDHFGIEFKAHSAIEDVRAAKELFEKCKKNVE